MDEQSKDRCIHITQQLCLLSIEKQRIIAEEADLQHELNTILITSAIKQTSDLNYSTQAKPSTAKDNPKPKKDFQDRDGTVIDIRDTVSFLTPTKYKGTEGVVHQFSPKRVTTLNKDDRKVVKDSSNIRVVKKAAFKKNLWLSPTFEPVLHHVAW